MRHTKNNLKMWKQDTIKANLKAIVLGICVYVGSSILTNGTFTLIPIWCVFNVWNIIKALFKKHW